MNTPNIRFKRFADDWEQRKLGDVIEEFYNGQTPYRQNRTYWDGDINWLSSGDLNRGIVTHTMEKITEEGKAASGLRIIPKGTLVIAIMGLEAAGTRGNCGVLAIDTTINQACMALIVDEKKVSSNFLFQWYKCFGNAYALKFTQGTKQQNYNAELLSDLDISYPKIEEQTKIGEYFSTLDNLITLHQRKCNDLQEVKKYMLQKMFPKKGAKVPEIRFAGFTGDWEQRKLEDYLVVSKEKNRDNSYSKEDVLSVSGDFGIVNQIEFQGRSFAGASVEKYGVVETGDVVYTKSPLKANPYGIIKTNLGKAGIVSTLYAVYKPRENTNSQFVQIYFEQDLRMNNYMHPLVNKGAKNDMKVSAENALKGYVTFPSVEEQGKIVEQFQILDNLITLHQQKCESLKAMKKYMLQNMFPQRK